MIAPMAQKNVMVMDTGLAEIMILIHVMSGQVQAIAKVVKHVLAEVV